jgi:hypothetical protein
MTDKDWPARAANQKYPWDEWLDGDIWQLTPGEDFTAATEMFRRQCYSAARGRGGKARASLQDGHLFLQYIKDGA